MPSRSRFRRLIGIRARKSPGKSASRCPASFDGNIGSILLQLDAMKDQVPGVAEEEKGVLRALKRLFLAGIYHEREIFSLSRVKEVCRKLEGLEMPDYQWRQDL